MKKYLLIFCIIFLFGCAHKVDTRRSDFVSGCFIGSSQVLSGLEIYLDFNALVDYCIMMYDSNEDIEKKLDKINKYIPPKKIAPKEKLIDFFNIPKSEKDESDFYYL